MSFFKKTIDEPLSENTHLIEESKLTPIFDNNTSDYYSSKELTKDVLSVIQNKTTIDVRAKRRKPSRDNLNKYYKLLLFNLDLTNYTPHQIFLELSTYFTDNVEIVYRMLDERLKDVIKRSLKESI